VLLIYKKLLIKKRTPDEYLGFQRFVRVKTNKKTSTLRYSGIVIYNTAEPGSTVKGVSPLPSPSLSTKYIVVNLNI
jgi:hypothetical protein